MEERPFLERESVPQTKVHDPVTGGRQIEFLFNVLGPFDVGALLRQQSALRDVIDIVRNIQWRLPDPGLLSNSRQACRYVTSCWNVVPARRPARNAIPRTRSRRTSRSKLNRNSSIASPEKRYFRAVLPSVNRGFCRPRNSVPTRSTAPFREPVPQFRRVRPIDPRSV